MMYWSLVVFNQHRAIYLQSTQPASDQNVVDLNIVYPISFCLYSEYKCYVCHLQMTLYHTHTMLIIIT